MSTSCQLAPLVSSLSFMNSYSEPEKNGWAGKTWTGLRAGHLLCSDPHTDRSWLMALPAGDAPGQAFSLICVGKSFSDVGVPLNVIKRNR